METTKKIFDDECWRKYGQTLDTLLTVSDGDGSYSLSGMVRPIIDSAIEQYAEMYAKQLLSDISKTFKENLHRAERMTDADIFEALSDTITNFPLPEHKKKENE